MDPSILSVALSRKHCQFTFNLIKKFFCDLQTVLSFLCRNSSWGLRDVDEVKKLAEQNALQLDKMVKTVT